MTDGCSDLGLLRAVAYATYMTNGRAKSAIWLRSNVGRTEPGAKTLSSMAAALIAPTTHEYADPSTIMRLEHALLSA
jgi:hypothetical protein